MDSAGMIIESVFEPSQFINAAMNTAVESSSSALSTTAAVAVASGFPWKKVAFYISVALIITYLGYQLIEHLRNRSEEQGDTYPLISN